MNPDLPAPTLRCRSLLAAASLGLSTTLVGDPVNPLDSGTARETEDLAAMQLLREGSILKKVMIPQYDEQSRLSSLLRAAQLTMVHKGLINAETLQVEFFNPDRSPKASIDMETATLIDQKILRSNEAVAIISEDLHAKGTGLIYELEKSRGFLKGPAEARTKIDQRTSMNTNSIHRVAIAGAMLGATVTLQAEGVSKLDEQQIEGLNQLAVSKEADAQAAADEAAESLERAEKESKQAEATLDDFLRKAALKKVEGRMPDLTTKVPDPETLNIKLPATFSADEGIYFDSEAGLLVFLKNVVAKHPEFTMVGADEVKVFFAEKEEEAGKPAEKEEDADKLMGDAEFGDPSKIIATGTIVIEKIKTDADDKMAKASGRQVVFDFETNELIIRGGEPWVISDTASGRVVDPNGYIRVNVETGDASFVGTAKGLIEADRND
ncbi:MAG: hypothetical protein AAGI48_10455 [Verrucomicrobiota bacterium]